MNPLRITLMAAAGAIAFAGVTMAQAPQSSPDSTQQSESAPKEKVKQKKKLTPEQKKERKAKKQAERKEARKLIRQSCREEAKKEGLRGLDLREYVQGCAKMR